MKTLDLQKKLDSAYEWYLVNQYDTVEYLYGRLPMTYEEWLSYEYGVFPFCDRFAPHDAEWIPSKIGSIQDDMETAWKAFESYQEEHKYDLSDEEYEASENYRYNIVYINACMYIKCMHEEDYRKAADIMRYYIDLDKSHMEEFMQYVKDMSNF